MAALEPSEDAISTVIEVTELDPVQDRDMVRQALKSNNGDAQTVILNWYEDRDGFRQKYTNKWDESMFQADRDGSNYNNGISFHIESSNQNDIVSGATPPPDAHGLTAPSRPPSRTNNRSPLARVVDWTAVNASVGPPTAHDQEDENLQRALRESAQEAGISVPAQESGVINASAPGPYFGPANRSDYDNNNWAMVPATKPEVTVRDYVPGPSSRKRVDGAPAFLVQGDTSVSEHRLGGLLTILHEIPLARNSLLEAGGVAASYGHNSEWWRGQEILAPHVLARLQAGEITLGDKSETSPVFEEEIHRLMAFLDSTDRSYGTVSVLFNLIPFPGFGPEKQFYDQFAQRNPVEVQPLYSKVILSQVQDGEDQNEEVSFGLLEVEHAKSEFQNIKTLYESIDHIIWGDLLAWGDPAEGTKFAYFREVGEVFVINMTGDLPDPNSFEIPEVFYPERWIENRKEDALRMMKSWEQTKRAISILEAAELRLYEVRDEETGIIHDRRVLAEKATEQWEAYREYLESRSRFRTVAESGFDSHKHPEYRSAPAQMTEEEQKQYERIGEVINYTKGLLTDVSQKVQALHAELDKIRAKQRILGRLLTDPNVLGRAKPMACNKYLLRGIATSPDVVYVCKREPEQLIDLEDGPRSRDQWWRLAYVAHDVDEPVKAEKLDFAQVSARIWKDNVPPMLVYATEMAVDTPIDPLPEALERFVKAENKVFAQELSREEREGREEVNLGSIDAMASPSKRKHRSDSTDSMLSNRASLGSDDNDFFDRPFEDSGFEDHGFMDHDPSPAAEMAQMVQMSPTKAGYSVRSSDIAGFGEGTKVPPPLPDRPPIPPKPTSLSSKPHVQGAPSSSEPPPYSETDTSPLPEMQELARPPAFISSNGNVNKAGTTVSDMSIPDHHE